MSRRVSGWCHGADSVLLLGAAARLALLLYGEWQDAHFAVKYTDIDYVVVTVNSA